MQTNDPNYDLENPTATAFMASLEQGNDITEQDIFAASVHIYTGLVSIPRSFAEQNLLNLAFQEKGYKDATHAFQINAVQAAFNMKDMVEKEFEKRKAKGESNV